MLEFTTNLHILDSDVWGHYVPVPQDIAEKLMEDKNRRVICYFDNDIKSYAALMHKGDGTFFINVRKELHKKLGVKLGDPIHIKIEKDISEYGMPMPEELGELLALDDEGSHYFHQLTPGKQRSLIYMVSKPKRVDTRIKKAVVIVDFLKHNKGVLDYKLLNEAFKESNNY